MFNKLRHSIGNWLFEPAKQGEAKASRTQVLMAEGGEVRWPERNYENYAKEAYLKCVIAYRCILEIAQAVSTVDWQLMKKGAGMNGKDKEIKEHPILEVIDYPNPMESGNFLRYKMQAFMELTGNNYLERVRLMTSKIDTAAKELYVLRPDRMKVLVNDRGGIKGYEYQVYSGKTIFPIDLVTGQADVLHGKTFHPINDWYGSAPTETAARVIDTHNEAITWNMRLLQNSARPGMLFFFKENLSDEQYLKFNEQLKTNHGGAMKAGKSLILEGEGADAKPYGWSPTDMDYINGNREKAREIALGYGVPPMLLGIPGDNTYSNYAEARLAFYETSITSKIEMMSWSFNNWLIDRKSGLYLKPDWDSIPALEPRRTEAWDKAEKSTFLTLNEKRDLVGYEEVDGGDVILVSSAQIPLDQALLPPEVPSNGGGLDGDED